MIKLFGFIISRETPVSQTDSLLAIIKESEVTRQLSDKLHKETVDGLLAQLKDLQDKVYFKTSQEYLGNKFMDTEKEEPQVQEEEMIPIENMNPDEIMKIMKQAREGQEGLN